MTSEQPIIIQLDGRIQLLAAVLSMTTWPYQEQDRQPHNYHPHALSTRMYLDSWEDHPAVQKMQDMLETGLSLDTIFSYTNSLNWPELKPRQAVMPSWAPEDWADTLRDFLVTTEIRDFWREEQSAWDKATAESRRALAGGVPSALLAQFFGPQDARLIFQPNLAYPSDRTLGFRRLDSIISITPPHPATGQELPNPYDSNPAATYAAAMGVYCRVLLNEYLDAHPAEAKKLKQSKLSVPNTLRARYPEWRELFVVLVANGLTAITLEATFGEDAAPAFLARLEQTSGFEIMHSVVDVLRHYLHSRAAGKYTEFAEFLSFFPRSLSMTESLRRL